MRRTLKGKYYSSESRSNIKSDLSSLKIEAPQIEGRCSCHKAVIEVNRTPPTKKSLTRAERPFVPNECGLAAIVITSLAKVVTELFDEIRRFCRDLSILEGTEVAKMGLLGVWLSRDKSMRRIQGRTGRKRIWAIRFARFFLASDQVNCVCARSHYYLVTGGPTAMKSTAAPTLTNPQYLAQEIPES